MRIKVTAHAMRCIDKAGGFDNYILNTPVSTQNTSIHRSVIPPFFVFLPTLHAHAHTRHASTPPQEKNLQSELGMRLKREMQAAQKAGVSK
jgi:3-phosphoglycerate kinase